MIYVTRQRLEEIEQMKKEDGLDEELEHYAFVELNKTIKLKEIEEQVDPVYRFIVVLINYVLDEKIEPSSVRIQKRKNRVS